MKGTVTLISCAALFGLGACSSRPDPEVRIKLAASLLHEGKAQEAVQIYEELANAGHPYAQFQLATLLHYGVGIAKDDERCVQLFGESCRGGFPLACNNYAHFIFQRGRYEEAERIFVEAADKRGDVAAIQNLIIIYRKPNWPGTSEAKAQHYEHVLKQKAGDI